MSEEQQQEATGDSFAESVRKNLKEMYEMGRQHGLEQSSRDTAVFLLDIKDDIAAIKETSDAMHALLKKIEAEICS